MVILKKQLINSGYLKGFKSQKIKKKIEKKNPHKKIKFYCYKKEKRPDESLNVSNFKVKEKKKNNFQTPPKKSVIKLCHILKKWPTNCYKKTTKKEKKVIN